jgi:hypothetical protein
VTQRTSPFAFVLILAAATLVATSLPAANLYWETASSTGELTGPNYFNFDATLSAQSPSAGDVLFVGLDGTANHSTPGLVEFQKLKVGHNGGGTGQTAHNGAGTVNISNGAQVNLTVGASGAANASLWVGNVQNGTLNIDGAGTSVTSARLIIIGYGNNLTRDGIVNITNGGALVAAIGNITMGEGTGNASNGVRGTINLSSGTVSVMSSGADLIVGNDNATCAVNQSGGLIEVEDTIVVGAGGSTGSSYTISSGTTTTGTGSFFVGRGAAVSETLPNDAGSINATLNISGDGILNVGNRLLVGSSILTSHAATGATVNQTGGTVTTTLDVRVGDANANNSVYNFSGGTINSTTGGHVGRQGTAQFNQTGGVANFNGTLNIGNREAALAANSGLYKISAGELNAGANNAGVGLTIAPSGTGELRVVGDDASIDVLGSLLVGNGANGVGTLAYEFETGDLLSTINVVNDATFATGSKLVLDFAAAAPTQTSYDLLTAVNIVDSGLVFEGPAGWSHQIVAGGNGQILRAVAPSNPTDDADFDGDGDVDGQDFLTWQRGLGGDPTLANGNANGDGVIDGADLAVWKNQFGPASVPAAAAVPEPSALILLAAAMSLIGAARTKTKRTSRV